MTAIAERPAHAHPINADTGFPALARMPVCHKCDGTGTYKFTMAPKLGQEGPCSRCTKGRMTGADISRYWAWQTRGYQDATLRVVVQNVEGAESHRDFAPDTLLFVLSQKGSVCWFYAEDVRVDDYILIPRVQSHEPLVCKVVGIVRKSRS